MDLYIVNELSPADGGPTAETVTLIVAALQEQLIQDWAPAWERLPLTLHVVEKETDAPATAPLMVLLFNATQASVLGYHTVTPSGRIYSPVFWEPIRDSGGTLTSGANSLSVTMSHETLELATNPLVDLMCDRDNGTDEEPTEVCDRVEGDAYTVQGVSVSNFLYPHAFSDSEPAPFDKLAKLTAREDMTDGGYVSLRSGGPAGTWNQVFGDKMLPHRRAQIKNPHPASRAARRVT